MANSLTYNPDPSSHCISVDWGTSRFRSKLIDRASGNIVSSIDTDMGIKKLFQIWSNQGGDRESFFLNYLSEQLASITNSQAIPIVISGMASSSIGIINLPYATIPFRCNGEGIFIKKLTWKKYTDILLISGVKSDSDVMRGEETQLIGVYQPDSINKSSAYIFPGTHSKHIFCQEDDVVDFHTFLTGEMFEILSQHSILKESVADVQEDQIKTEAFLSGVSQSIESNLLNEFFKIRAKHVLGSNYPTENTYYLSGLLIGYELSSLKKTNVEAIYLCAQGMLAKLYSLAAKALNVHCVIPSKEIVDQATTLGHLKILNSYNR